MFGRYYYRPRHPFLRLIFYLLLTAFVLGGGYYAYRNYINPPRVKQVASNPHVAKPTTVTHRASARHHHRTAESPKKLRWPSAKQAGKWVGIASIIIALFGLPFLMTD